MVGRAGGKRTKAFLQAGVSFFFFFYLCKERKAQECRAKGKEGREEVQVAW